MYAQLFMFRLHRCDWYPGSDWQITLCINAYPNAQFLYINMNIEVPITVPLDRVLP